MKESLLSSKKETIILKTPDEIEKMRRSNLIVAEILESLKGLVKPGVTTGFLDKFCEREAIKRGAKPAFKGYRGYPYSLCASLNDEVVHSMPSEKRCLKEGDILSLDFGVFYDGFYGDAAITLPVGGVDDRAIRIIDVTREALYKGIEMAVSGNRLFDISAVIQGFVEDNGYSVIRDFVGHGIGRDLHELPQIPNFGKAGMGVRLKNGMVLAIEPMVAEGGYDVRILDDGWTAVTADGSLSAHFEHTVAVTNGSPYILSNLQGV